MSLKFKSAGGFPTGPFVGATRTPPTFQTSTPPRMIPDRSTAPMIRSLRFHLGDVGEAATGSFDGRPCPDVQ